MMLNVQVPRQYPESGALNVEFMKEGDVALWLSVQTSADQPPTSSEPFLKVPVTLSLP
jgi:hypothetical protein